MPTLILANEMRLVSIPVNDHSFTERSYEGNQKIILSNSLLNEFVDDEMTVIESSETYS